jgi:hypothetical protein
MHQIREPFYAPNPGQGVTTVFVCLGASAGVVQELSRNTEHNTKKYVRTSFLPARPAPARQPHFQQCRFVPGGPWRGGEGGGRFVREIVETRTPDEMDEIERQRETEKEREMEIERDVAQLHLTLYLVTETQHNTTVASS